jgi:hypothetical protein
MIFSFSVEFDKGSIVFLNDGLSVCEHILSIFINVIFISSLIE